MPQILHYSVITSRRHSSHPAMATAGPMSSIRPQQRQVRPLFSPSLTTHETFRRNCKVSAEQDKSKWSDPGLAALVMLLRFYGLGADPEQIRHRFGRARIGIPEML